MIMDMLSENIEKRPNFSSFLPSPPDPSNSFSCVATRAVATLAVFKTAQSYQWSFILQTQIFMRWSGLDVTTSPSARYVWGRAL